MRIYKPGESAPVSGEYEIKGPRGGDTGKERTAIQGKPLPPTPKSGLCHSSPRAQRGRKEAIRRYRSNC
jgi:hypothetical protein